MPTIFTPIVSIIGRYALTALATLGVTKVADWFAPDAPEENRNTGIGWVAVLSIVVGVILSYFIFKKK